MNSIHYIEKTIVLSDGKLIRVQMIEPALFEESHVFLPFGFVFWMRKTQQGKYSMGFYKS